MIWQNVKGESCILCFFASPNMEIRGLKKINDTLVTSVPPLSQPSVSPVHHLHSQQTLRKRGIIDTDGSNA